MYFLVGFEDYFALFIKKNYLLIVSNNLNKIYAISTVFDKKNF